MLPTCGALWGLRRLRGRRLCPPVIASSSGTRAWAQPRPCPSPTPAAALLHAVPATPPQPWLQVDDLRLTRAWPALLKFAASFDLAALDDQHHKHVPYGARAARRSAAGLRAGMPCVQTATRPTCQHRLCA
jgi:hypothetical protein